MPQTIGEYEILQSLGPRGTFLARDTGGRTLVLKMLDNDCLLAGQLHPAIRQRLNRVREIAHGAVANLYGVQRDGSQVFLVWEFVPGDGWQDWIAKSDTSAQQRLLTARNLVLAFEAMNSLGIVHGAIHANNVIVDAGGRIKLTHVSPLLYSDPSQDIAAVANLVGLSSGQCESLRDIAAALGAQIEGRRESPDTGEDHRAERRVKRRALLAAAAVAVIAIAVFCIVHWALGRA